MNEITKLYENAGIKPLPTCNNCNMLDEYWSNGTYCSTCKCDKDNDECNIANYIYPPFTAEKQIYIIKWLSDKDDYIGIHYDKHKGLFNIQTNSSGLYVCNEFEQALASRVNFIWQSLTEAEQNEIRNIL